MGYKSILTYVDRHDASKAQLANAIEFAEQYDATLTAMAYAANHLIPDYDIQDDAGSSFSNSYEQAQAIVARLYDQTMQACTAADIRFSVETFVSINDEWGAEFGRHARYTDLVLLGPINDDANKRTASDAFEAALYTGDVPVMICPPEMPSTVPETVLIGWNGSREALRSIRAAMPILCAATKVDIAIVDQSSGDEKPGEDLLKLLARNGVDASVSSLSSNLSTVDETLRIRAEDIGAGLMVIGAYSRSWFREYFLGGVTREIIARPTIPVLLAH